MPIQVTICELGVQNSEFLDLIAHAHASVFKVTIRFAHCTRAFLACAAAVDFKNSNMLDP